MPASAPFASTFRELFGGQLRYRILRTLYEQPDQEFHLRGLAAAAAVDAGNAHRMLKKLVEAQLCEMVPDKPFVKYRAPKNGPFYQDLVRLFSRGSELIGDIRAVAGRLEGTAAIFGSAARGEAGAESDVDVLLIGPLSTIEAQAAFKGVGRRHGRRINAIAITETELVDNLEAGSAFWHDVLTQPLIMLNGEIPDEVSRRLSQGGKPGISRQSAGPARNRKLPARIRRQGARRKGRKE